MALRFSDLVKEAERLSECPGIAFDSFVLKVEEWVNSLPPEERERAFVIPSNKGSIVVKRSELPKKLREDPEFLKWYIQHLANLEKSRRNFEMRFSMKR